MIQFECRVYTLVLLQAQHEYKLFKEADNFPRTPLCKLSKKIITLTLNKFEIY